MKSRLLWQMENDTRGPQAWVTQTRRGHGFRRNTEASQDFVIDFEGPALTGLAATAVVNPVVTPVTNAEILEAITQYLGITQETLERLQVLREQVTETLNDEFSVVATDLAQLRGILGDAAEKLSGTFRVMNASADELRRTIAQVRETPDVEVLSRLGAIAGEMASTTGTTVQSLQFDDMAAQLLQLAP